MQMTPAATILNALADSALAGNARMQHAATASKTKMKATPTAAAHVQQNAGLENPARLVQTARAFSAVSEHAKKQKRAPTAN